MPFVGTHDHTLDSKGRLVLPSKFRSHFTDGAYLSPWAGCVALWTTERFTEMVRRIAEEIRAGDTDSDVQRALGANSEMVRPDARRGDQPAPRQAGLPVPVRGAPEVGGVRNGWAVQPDPGR